MRKQIPRKGTETFKFSEDDIIESDEKTDTPKGDGNIYGISYDIIIMMRKQIPRKGTETIR